jgi:uncharacterized protein
MEKPMENPFKYGGIVRGPYFAGRNEEVKELTREMINANRVFLISPRRMGKTCLIHHLMDKLKTQGIAVAFVDLNALPDLRSFAETVTRRMNQALETNTEKLIQIFSGLRKLRPKLTIGKDGNIEAGVEVVAEDKEAIPALLEGLHQAEVLAAKKKKRLVTIIDEFSDLVKYNGQTLEKALRSEIQTHQHIDYLFAGSEQSVMLSLIQDKTRAFYKMGRIMELGPIARKEYRLFISNWFKKAGFCIDRERLDQIFDIGHDVPLYIQRLCHNLWEEMRDGYTISKDLIEQIPAKIVRQDSPHYEVLWIGTSQGQRILLQALAKEPGAKPFSKAFQFRYGIGPSSSIKASFDSLIKKGILYRSLQGDYQFSDIFMAYWINSLMG